VGIEPVRWGLLSTANINRALIPGLNQSPDSELVAVASRTDERAAEYAREWGIPTAHGSYEALLEDPDVEAVYISLPNAPHVEWTVRALEAGKHVLCEKPMSRHPGEVERAFDVAEREGRLLMEAFMWRHHPQTKRLEGLVRDGIVGDVRLVRASFSFTIESRTDIRLSAELEGGALMDVGCYCIGACRLVAGEPVGAQGREIVGETGVDMRFVGTLAFPSGALALIDCGFDLPGRAGIEVCGSKGTLFVNEPFHVADPGIHWTHNGGTEMIEVDQGDRYRLQTDNFSRAIRGAEAQLLGREDALGQARVIDALYRSAESGSALNLAS
jgi:D-xylose 1-dehydrogenase (NADP+, D-xylono-1,5-lactone-forming)